MKITSAAFEHNQQIPARFTCQGEDVNPPLEFHDIPEGTKSLVLIVDDPDAPGKTWVHWILYNMSPNIAFIKENSTPGNVSVGMNDFGRNDYGGPCPPSGTHRYFFKLFALDARLEEMPDFTDKEMLTEAMNTHVLAETELIGLFSKS
jgi:Raf kinase inhibitor-like YbhB/YbcL family protein